MASNFGRAAMGLILVVSLLGFWTMAQPKTIYACSCMFPDSPSVALEKADAVFLGRAVSVTGVEKDGYVDSLITEFDVATVWKGPVSRTIHIGSGASEAGCGYVFTEGEYIVYAYYSEYREGLWTGLCGRTTELSRGMEDLAELGEGEKPGNGTTTSAQEGSASSGGCSRSAGAVDLAFVGLLVGVVCFGLRKRRAETG